jgi:subtilisin-like proprotein convertase family protein
MQHAQPRLARPAPPDTRIVTIAVAALALLLLAVSVYYLNEFRLQRAEARRNADLLNAWDEQLLTATPAAQEAAYLESQLTEAQAQFGEASGDLPSSDINEDAVFERISEAARLSGVNLLTTSQSGTPTQDGNLVYKYYTVAASGDLDRLNNFASRLEEEAFPTAYFSDDATLTANADGTYTLAGTLTIPTYTTSTGDISNPSSIPTGNSPEQLRALAADAMTQRDYELAISYLLRLAATEPPPADINDLLYEAYIAYGNDLLSRGLASAAQEQCISAQLLRPDSPDATACLLTAAQMVTATPATPGNGEVVVVVSATVAPATATPTSGIPTPTPTLQPTVELPPTRTPPPPTNPPPPATNTPEFTATLTPTPTVTGTPPTATPPPTATFANGGGGDGLDFGPLTPVYLPNCGLTQVKGTIRDARTNATLNGVTVRVWYDGAPDDEFYSLPSGTDPTKGGGEWDVVLWPGPKAGRWYVQVVDRPTGTPLSQRVTVETDVGPCQAGGTGRQVVIQDFFRYGGPIGTIVPSATPSVGPSTTGTPSVTLTPSTTGTPTNTPTVTATPTSTPLPFFVKDEDPNKPIPDGPNGRITSTLTVDSAVVLRQLRVELNITHSDAGDLHVTLVHPDGSRIVIHAEGEDSGTENIRKWFQINEPALSAIKNKSIQGTWILEVEDRREAETGELLSWRMEVYP